MAGDNPGNREEDPFKTSPTSSFHIQVHDIVEGADPRSHIVARTSNEPKANNREGPSVVSGRI